MATRPRVFLSFAQADEPAARRLRDRLETTGAETFYAPDSIEPGENLVAAISRGLEYSDYFVLLLSRAALARPWVELEWTSALAREVGLRQAFLIVVRLDDAPLPALLSARRYLNASEDWERAVQGLLEVWKRDAMAAGVESVLPSPGLSEATATDAREHAGVYVFNDRLRYQYFLRVPRRLSGRQLYALVKTNLRLRDQVDALDGLVGLRFEYTLYRAGERIAADAEPVLDVEPESCLDLVIAATFFGPDGEECGAEHYRTEVSGTGDYGTRFDERMHRELQREAFRHLFPKTR